MNEYPPCAHPGCGHDWDKHGDRALAACDGLAFPVAEVVGTAPRCPCDGYRQRKPRR